MSPTVAPALRTIARLRQASGGRPARGAIAALALLIGGMQLALQTHLIKHDLLPSNHPVCEQCVVAKGATPPPTVVAVMPPSADPIIFLLAAPSAPSSRAPLVERSRGPPASA
jgi:hypothetical protein